MTGVAAQCEQNRGASERRSVRVARDAGMLFAVILDNRAE
ncbi:hypothetical protein PLANPX_0778 [Lacipirellula parvula]|uniref:Uncharacterized protein n=1 Tax=Lacipirellula parvula TaxID=2650471 RepID=A0A5K7XA13_9BACT|nr:hypothetical protein PLANPX_0778 [Lacipirellula parvula]